jgi:YD repeat-containing protein
MKKHISALAAIVFALFVITSCSYIAPVGGKTYTTSLLGLEHGYKFERDGSYEEYSELGTIETGTFEYNFQDSTVTLTSTDGKTQAFTYDFKAKTLTQSDAIINITYKLKK